MDTLKTIKDYLVNSWEHCESAPEKELEQITKIPADKFTSMVDQWANGEYVKYMMNMDLYQAEEDLDNFIRRSL